MTTWQKLTDEEEAVLNLLGEAWNKFRQLPEQHPTHNAEMMYAIHQAERLILARVGSRSLGYLPAILEASQKGDLSDKDASFDGVAKPSIRQYVIKPDSEFRAGTPQAYLAQVAGMVSVRVNRRWVIGYRIYDPYADDMCIVKFAGSDAEISSDQWRGYFIVNLLEFQRALRESDTNEAAALTRLIKKLAAQIGVKEKAEGEDI